MAFYQSFPDSRAWGSVFSLDDIFALRPNRSVVLRASTDIACIWASFIAVLMFLDSRGNAMAVDPRPGAAIALIALFSVLALVVYAGAGLYARRSSLSLGGKILRIILANLALMTTGFAVLLGMGGTTWLAAGAVLLT